MADPKCPSCGVEGISFIVSKGSDETSKDGNTWFNVAHCSECGHIYGVFAKIVNSRNVPFVNPPAED
jgi:uncharacterized Zn finger protein